MSKLRIGDWSKNSYFPKSNRARMGLRRRGVTMSYWQRVAQKEYIESETVIQGLTVIWKDSVAGALADVMEWTERSIDEVLFDVVTETEQLAHDLEWTTPKDPEGPNDPPMHAKDSWRVVVEDRGSGQIHVSVSNPKHYIQFLETYGGVHDSWGDIGGPGPGWISDIFEDYALRLRMIK